jgi:alginate O-acetyltransferase complex protein AlgI
MFLPITLGIYYLLPRRFQNLLILLSALFFYAWGEPKYIMVLLFSIVINYTLGILIHKYIENRSIAKFLLIAAIACNLGILFYFKYFNFALNTTNLLFNTGFVHRNILLPIGISFFLFQGMSYIIDLYWRKVDVQKDPIKIALYIAYFPQLMAGPIIRYIDIKEQINNRTETMEKFVAGAQRFVIGLAKKIIIADNLAIVADQVFSNPAIENTPAGAWIGVICFTFQLYFDFSGYSDMAIGLAKMFGFEFRENFNYPYISKTMSEFWRRWHISLSSWFRDYVYIPLGGSRKGNPYANIFFVFFLTGLWHGANFNCVLWGIWNGIILIIERLFGIQDVKKKALIPLRYVMTMLIFIIGLAIFRSPGLFYARDFLGIMFGIIKPENVGFLAGYYLSPKIIILLCISAIASTPISQLPLKFYDTVLWQRAKPILSIALLFISIVFVTASSFTPFIYFRF